MVTTSPVNAPKPMRNRVTDLLGVDYPIIQAPMSLIARYQLASAVSNAGGLGILETGSFTSASEFNEEISRLRALTDKPFGVNITMLTKKEPQVIDSIVDAGVRFVTTSAGDPNRYTKELQSKGLTVFHVVPSLSAALKALAAGVDGLVVEGGEGGGFKSTKEVSSMVLIPLIASKVNIPIIAAGGIGDGVSMAAAFALGAEGVQMGTRMLSSLESPVHDNWKNAIVAAKETDTVMLSRFQGPALRALRTEYVTSLETLDRVGMSAFKNMEDLYFGGDMESSLALGGQIMGRIDEVLPVKDIVWSAVEECRNVLSRLDPLR